MKHLTYTDKSLLVGDQVADLLTRYAALVADQGHADTVDVHGFGADGQEVVATYVLTAGTALMAETISTTMSEPENGAAEDYLTRAIDLIVNPPTVAPDSDVEAWPDIVENYDEPRTD